MLPLWLAIRGRYNFANLSRWGGMGEDTYRQNFGKPFDWLGFNVELASSHLGTEQVIAFDPCFLPKSGKHTPGVGYFYSGCAGRELRGLKFSGIATIDLADKAALHLEAVQTINLASQESLLTFYARVLSKRRLALQRLSKYIVADAYFAKRPFVVSLAKVAHHLNTPVEKRKAFSMANVKTQYANDLLLDRFIATFGISAQLSKINSIRERIRAIGKIAA